MAVRGTVRGLIVTTYNPDNRRSACCFSFGLLPVVRWQLITHLAFELKRSALRYGLWPAQRLGMMGREPIFL